MSPQRNYNPLTSLKELKRQYLQQFQEGDVSLKDLASTQIKVLPCFTTYPTLALLTRPHSLSLLPPHPQFQ